MGVDVNSGTVTIKGVTPTIDKVTFDGADDTTKSIEVNGTNGGTAQMKAVSVKGTDITEGVTWRVSAKPEGATDDDVSINPNTGAVTVGEKAKAGDYTITAAAKSGSSQGESKNATLTVTHNTTAATTATALKILSGGKEVGGTDIIGIPSAGSTTEKAYIAQAYNVFEEEISGATLALDSTAPTGISFANDSGKVTVTSGATDGDSITLKASCTGLSDKTVTITAKEVSVNWDPIVAKSEITYGQTARDAFTTLPSKGTATAYVGTEQTTLQGDFSAASTDLSAGDKTVTVTFTVTSEGSYKGNKFTKDYTVKVNPLEVTLAWANTKLTYNTTEQAPTATVTNKVGSDDVTVTVTGGQTNANTSGNPTYTATANALAGAAAANYKLPDTKPTTTFTIGPKEIELEAPKPVTAIYANSSDNNDAAALGTYVGKTNGTIKSTDQAAQVTFTATWSLKDPTKFDRKGGTYTLVAELSNPTRVADEMGNYKLPTAKPEVTVEVKPVTATPAAFTEAGKTVAKSVITKDDFALSALSLPRQTGAVTYTPAEANVTTGPDVPDKFTVDSWTSNNAAVTAASLKAEAGRVTDSANVDVVMTPVYSDAPAWATLGTAPTYTLTITNKYPVKVTVTAPSDITFGAALGDPSATQVEIDDGTDDSGNASFTYKYVGVEGTTYDSADKPTAAGKYQVVATLVSATHSGTGTSATFTISPKTIEFGDGKDFTAEGLDEDLTYNGSAQTLSALVIKDGAKDLVLNTDYTLAYADNTDASTSAKVTVTGKGNYGGTPQLTFTIKPFTLAADNTSISGLNTSGYTYTGAAIKPTFSVNTTGFGALTTADYTVTYDPAAATAAGDVKISIAGNGNFDGTVTDIATYTIKPAALTGTVTLTLTKGDANSDPDNASVYEVGDKLTANFSKLSESTEGNLAFQWYNKAGKIETATGKDYVIQEGDEEVYVEVSVAEGATSNYAGTVASQKVAVDKKSIPADVTVSITVDVSSGKITLTAKVTLSGTNAADIAGSFAIQWYRNGAAVGSPITVTESSGSLVDVPYPTDAAAQPAGGEVWTCALVPTADNTDYTGSVPASSVTNNASSDASASNGDVTIKATAPSAPTNVQTTLTKGQTTGSVKVTWGMPANMNGCDLDGWEVTCTPAGGVAVTKKLGASDPREVTFDNLTNGTEYTFTVKALTTTTGITGDASAGAKVTPTAPTPVTPPTDPTTPSRPGGGSGSGSSSSDDDDDTVTIRSSSRDHGTVRLSSSSARKGDTVTVTVKPDRGYEVDEVLVYSSNGTRLDVRSIGGDEYTFTMPSGTVRVEVTYKRTGTQTADTFTDVPSTYWAADAIKWVSENGYMMGNTAVTFNPEGRITRQQMWMIMARMAGSNPYDFSDARAWAIANGISDGSNPGNSVTRQQMVAILYRYAQMMDYRTTGGTDLSAFPDSGSVASYAQEALQWSVGNGIVGGTASGTLNPGGTATRAQFATILQRFYANVAR